MAGILERRRTVRRALASGAVLGAAAGVAVGLLDAVYVWSSAAASFDGVAEIARFLVTVAGTLAGAGVLLGLAQGMVAAAVGEAAHAFGQRRSDAAVWQARIYTILAVPVAALVSAQVFAGPHARTIPHHDLYAAVLGLGALGLFWGATRLWLHLYHSGLPGRRAGLTAVALALAGVGLYLVDQRVLVRLYPYFHAGLGLGVFGAAELALALAHRGASRRDVRMLRPAAALVIGCLALTSAALSLGAIGRTRALRTVVLERTVLAAPMVRLVAHREPPRPVNAAPVAAATVDLPEGPHLGPVDIFLVTIDALRADRVNARTAPFLTSLAERGVRFDRAYTQVPHTSFSLATLLTGKYVFALSTLGLDAASHETLAGVLKRERYKTAAFFPPSVFTIDRERLKPMEESSYGFEYVKYEHMDAPGRTDQVIHFLEAEHPAHAFVWVHYFEPHEPYDPHPGPFADAKEAIDRYDGEVRFADQELERLVTYLMKARPHALVVVAADHGEEFGEHGGRYHGTSLYEEQVRVPLVFAPLDGTGLTPHHVAAPVGLVDVGPTLLSLIGITPSAKMRGRDLGPWLLPAGKAAPDDAHGPVFAEIMQQKMIVDGNRKLVCDLATDSCSAFDLAVDPSERKNRIDEPWTAALRGRLDAWMAGESRFEHTGSEGDARTRKLLERGRLGDKTVAPELATLVDDPAVRGEVVHLLASLPPAPATRAALGRVVLEPDRAWADVALARLGDPTARARLPGRLESACAEGQNDNKTGDLCARAALALGDVTWLGRALGRGDADEQLQLELSRALGHSHDPRALDPLVLQLANVRLRADTLEALSQLDDARVLPTLLMWVAAEPYVPARARMVALIAQLGRHEPAPARTTLHALALAEREAPVMAALMPALHALGDPDVVPLASAHPRTIAGGELWIWGRGSGTLAVDGNVALALTDGVGHALTPRAAAATIKPVDGKGGDAVATLAFSRPAP